MSQTRIVIIPPAASMPAPFLTFDEGGRVLQRGSLLLEDPQTTPDVRTVAVAPGADVLVRWLDLPVGGAAQVRAAARWALKDELAGDPERTVVAVAPAARGEETDRILGIENSREILLGGGNVACITMPQYAAPQRQEV